jgi:hypothetical protein
MKDSTDYHDYIFRDGKLVGEFEEMYRNSVITPWHQDKRLDWMDIRLTLNILFEYGRFDQIHDFGCGTGHYLDLMSRHFLKPKGRAYGYDISETACNLARRTFPQGEFSVIDLTKQIEKSAPQAITNKDQASRLFMIRGTLWYVFPKLATVIDNIRKMMSGHDRLLVVQNFPPLQDSFIGKDVISNHHDLIDHFSCHFNVERHLWYEDRLNCTNDNWFIGVFTLSK